MTVLALTVGFSIRHWQATRLKTLYQNKLRNAAGYENCKTLKKAVYIVRLELDADDKHEYAELLTEDNVRNAIRTSVRSYDAKYDESSTRTDLHQLWQNDFKPTYLSIADSGQWPSGSAFTAFYALQDKNWIVHEGLGLRLKVVAKDGHIFDLPILDLYYGRLPP